MFSRGAWGQSAQFGVAVGLVLVSVGAAGAAGDIDADNLRPGLVTTYRDAATPTPVEIVQLEPTIALALKADEAPHPRLAAGGGTVRWQGYLQVPRPGAYRFDARLRGRLRLTVAGKAVLEGEVKAETPALLKGPATDLAAGVHPIEAEFTRLPGIARLELFWQSPHFHAEPLPHDFVGHLPAREPARLAADRLAEHGRFLAEEGSCTRCHQPAGGDRVGRGLLPRQGPDLSDVGRRVYAGWIYRWLEAPHALRPGAVMPRMFHDDEAGRVERYAVTRYLASLGGPLAPATRPMNPRELRASAERGRRLFTSTGCIACHREEKGKGPKGEAGPLPDAVRWFPLANLGSKTTPERLAAYLANPLTVDPSGRMPRVPLQGGEVETLARSLCQERDAAIPIDLPAAPAEEAQLAAFRSSDPRPEELAAFRRLPPDARWTDLGKRLVIDKGCNNCHTIAPGGKPFASVLASASFDDLKKPAAQTAGCLADESGKRGRAPWFAWTAAERRSLRAFLREGTAGAGSPAPMHASRVALRRFNCLACHTRDGEGGLSTELVEELRLYEKAENAEAIVPPTLTGVAHKLRTAWLRQVLTGGARARPWMGLRMPQFGDANVGRLPEALASCEGTVPDDRPHQVPLTAGAIATGRRLVGKSAFGCISCHDLAGIANTGTRGPDLAGMNQRVRYEWYRRWLEQPQRYQPGTRMPTVFPDGKSLLTSVLGGSADAQAEALWAYLALGPGLPLPEGLEPPRGMVLTVKDRPVLLRTFMPETGARAVAVGYPGGVSVAFDAATCRLAYAWSGNFLDSSGAWDGRGGTPAKVLGPRFWTAPPGCPWAVNASHEPPDFAAQARDPAYGGPVPEGKLYTGPRRLQFEGYAIDQAGTPTFRYRLVAEEDHPLEVSERPAALHNAAGPGLLRHFGLTVPGQRTAWLLASEGQEPRLLDAKGQPQTADLKAGRLELSATGRAVVLPQGGERAVVLVVRSAPEGTRWLLERRGATWQALLRLPETPRPTEVGVDLEVWGPYRDEPGLLKELLTAPPPGRDR
jgi:mono/diheme cytochrome c family protein